MSCEECDKIQDLALNKNISETPPIFYIRVGTANLVVIGCEKHLIELRDKLRKCVVE